MAKQRNLELRVLDEFSTTRSGRSFNNASQCPIFSWILTDFDSFELDLKDEKIYRDLSLPAVALGFKENEANDFITWCSKMEHSKICFNQFPRRRMIRYLR